MSPNAEQLYAAAQALTEPEREEVAIRLLDSLGDGPVLVEKEWQDEIQRRLAMIDRGEVELIPDEVVMRRIEEKYGRLRD